MNKPFKFKEFTVNQDRCAMKIGTDSVLLGSWSSIDSQPNSILDIGSGTGVLSLMMAQRSSTEIIDALEIDAEAYEQCVENFEASPWADRLFCYHASLEEFLEEIEDSYDLIICNPPYFKGPNNFNPLLTQPRTKARFTSSLSFEELCKAVSRLLSKMGVFSVIIPYLELKRFILSAESFQLYPLRILNVRGNSTSEIKRSLVEFSFNKIQPSIKEMTIEKERHIYTAEYTELTKDFYLNM